jgi:hypothetical protein
MMEEELERLSLINKSLQSKIKKLLEEKDESAAKIEDLQSEIDELQ